MLWYCCFAFRWGKGHFKKSPRSKSPATVEHDRALPNMQRSYRRYKLPRTVSTFSENYCQRVYDSLQFAQCFHMHYFVWTPQQSHDAGQMTMFILQMRKLIFKRGRWLVRAHPSAKCRRWDLNLGLSNIKSHVLHYCTLLSLCIKFHLAMCIYLTMAYWDLLCVRHSSEENGQKSLPSWSLQSGETIIFKSKT